MKYELDKELGAILHTAMLYPFNYGLPLSVWGTTVQAYERTVNLVKPLRNRSGVVFRLFWADGRGGAVSGFADFRLTH